MNLVVIVLIVAMVGLAGCASPETSRKRGSGPGADVGNRTKTVQMHEGSKPYENTPKLIPGKSPALDSASQADRKSR